MLSFSNFVLHEDVKKNQINSLFRNLDFKIGLEFEFYNKKILEDLQKGSKVNNLKALNDFGEKMMLQRKENNRIMNRNAQPVKDTSKKTTEVVTAEKFLGNYNEDKLEQIYVDLGNLGFHPKEVTEIVHCMLFWDITKNKSIMDNYQEYEKRALKPGQLKMPILKKYKDEKVNRLNTFVRALAENAKGDHIITHKDLKKYYGSNENLPNCVKNPIITWSEEKGNPKRWVIKKDISIPAGEGGIEFITPVMSPFEAISVTKEMFEYIRKVGNTNSQHVQQDTSQERKYQCGLHINLSMNGEKMKNFNALKFVIFSNEGQIDSEKLFDDRKNAEIIRPVIKNLKKKLEARYPQYNATQNNIILGHYLKDNMKGGIRSLIQEIENFGKNSTVNTTNYNPRNRSVRRKGSERIEVRYFGGENYEKKFDTFQRVLGELLYALDVSTDPEKEKNKFYKSAYKILDKMRRHIERKKGKKNEN